MGLQDQGIVAFQHWYGDAVARSDLPRGTVTFVFTDIEGSTRLLQEQGNQYPPTLERHNRIIVKATADHEGVVVKNEGDGFFMVFRSAVEAVECAVGIQRAMASEDWPPPRPVSVRIGVHTGEGSLGGSDYIGMDVHRAARIGAAGHGGQILLSAATARLTEFALPAETYLKDIGTHRLRDITHEEHLYQLSIEGQPTDFPPIRATPSSAGNLPRRVLDFVGRRDEREQVARAMRHSRLVTISGPGGVGKTALAFAVAEDLTEEFGDGVWMVEMSRVVDESSVVLAVARSLHITEAHGQPLLETLASRLSTARMLLILDGCEHLVAAVAALVARLLQQTSVLRILVTSREWLSIRGEQLVQLAPLDVPPDQVTDQDALAAYDAVAMFVNRAALARPGFEIDDATAGHVAELTRRLDGIPLAIEIAAARLKVLTVSQLVHRLDQQFAMLSASARDLPPRQQTLETTIDWSYDFLTIPEQTLFARLSVFAGGFTLEAVEEVCPGGEVDRWEVLDLLGRLVETSLVMVTGSDPARYRLLEPLGQYARMRLEEIEGVEETAELHARYYADFAETIEPELLGDDQTTWITRVELERHNLVKSLEWFEAAGLFDEVLRVAGAVRWFWVIRRDITEGSRWLEEGIAGAADADHHVLGRALNGLGLIALMRLDFSRAEGCLVESQQRYIEAGDEAGAARQQYHLAVAAWLQDDYDRAKGAATKSLELARRVGDHWAEGWTLAVSGTMARLTGDLDTAVDLMNQSHQVLSEHGGALDLGWSHLRLAAIARDEGNYQRAVAQYRAGRDHLAAAGDILGMAHADAGLGALSWLADDHDHAVDLYLGVLQGFGLFEEASNNLFELKTMIQGNQTTSELMQVVEANRGRAKRVEDAKGAKAALAEYLYHMGKTAHRRSEIQRAREALTESLRLGIQAEDARAVAIAVAALAVISAQSDELATAARLFGLAERLATEQRLAPWPPVDEPGWDELTGRLAVDFEGFDAERGAGAALDPSQILAPAL
ncbi:MAG: NB-ARC domain-containing protein [Actinobacteria bacterium]|nr:NB-ARC domain-containing protein [Actinomycetota bacterium]